MAQRTAPHPLLRVMISETAFSQILRLGLFSAALNICCSETTRRRNPCSEDGSYSHEHYFYSSVTKHVGNNRKAGDVKIIILLE